MDNKLKATADPADGQEPELRRASSPLLLSFVYTPRQDRTFRLSFSSAVRNPTLADQYLYYNVGRALLLGQRGWTVRSGQGQPDHHRELRRLSRLAAPCSRAWTKLGLLQRGPRAAGTGAHH